METIDVSSLKRVSIATPFYRNYHAEFVMSLVLTAQTCYQFGFRMQFLTYENCYIHVARNFLAKLFVEDEYFEADYLLFIDSDMAWGVDAIPALIKADKDIIGGLYFSRDDKCMPHAYKYYAQKNIFGHITEIPNDAFSCDGTGGWFLMIKRHVMEAVMKNEKYLPFDLIEAGRKVHNGTTSFFGEELSFCMRAKAAGFEIWCDPGFHLDHIGRCSFSRETYKAIMSRPRQGR